uniref:Predicted RNA-binding protein, contains PUA-like domain n=1 Tax=Candidatus Kentrum sp. TUN TaxID=2126343 RepID=A0A451AGA8_9GAMM|nr:MAG: Predicted RNA-binding protein, contains PUA-like domain [Candidatus Kentron sp. TUN]VFK65075.1 MAG: Predicted RNA-binding protein, contains PUA-like domain [Candidatus Kentron sp. TUN]VFK68370.1 MAG: Predicted RNA-binding protein, contains PUA-like domain [Candidatus Kentron sp. TUN]
MQYWLMKSEPGEFSIQDLARRPDQREPWDGVRNYQARNMLRDRMQPKDLAFFYHSNCSEPGIVGIMRIVRGGYPDTCALDPEDQHFDPKSNPQNPRWYRVDVELVRIFPHTLPLRDLKQYPELVGMPLVQRGNRLSIMPVSEAEWEFILSLVEEYSTEGN